MQSVNTGKLVPNPAKGGVTAFGQRPVGAPGCAKDQSGVGGDAVGDRWSDGGDDQAEMQRLVSERLE